MIPVEMIFVKPAVTRASGSLWRFTFLRVAAALLVLLALMGMAGYLLVTRPALEHRAASMAAALLAEPQADCAAVKARIEQLANDEHRSGVTMLEAHAEGGTIATTAWLLPLDAMLVARLRQQSAVKVEARSAINTVHLQLTCGGSSVRLALDRRIALGVAPAQALAAWLVGLLGGTLGLAAWLSGALNAPLRRLARHVQSTPLGAEPVVAQATGIIELDRLALEVDALRERASEAVGSRTALLMALSHELRTPLARVRLILDTAQLVTAADGAEMKAHVLEMQEALDEFMRAANAMAAPLVQAGAQAVWLRLQALFTDPRVVFTHAQGAPDATLNAAALLRIASNLIDNALRHGEGRVDVSWSQRADSWCLRVADEGTGIPVENMLQSLRAFSSGAVRDAGAPGHAGVGLALARILCEHNGWTLHFGNRQPGGLLVSVANGMAA